MYRNQYSFLNLILEHKLYEQSECIFTVISLTKQRNKLTLSQVGCLNYALDAYIDLQRSEHTRRRCCTITIGTNYKTERYF